MRLLLALVAMLAPGMAKAHAGAHAVELVLVVAGIAGIVSLSQRGSVRSGGAETGTDRVPLGRRGVLDAMVRPPRDHRTCWRRCSRAAVRRCG